MKRPEEVEFFERVTHPSISMSLDDDEEDYPEEVRVHVCCTA